MDRQETFRKLVKTARDDSPPLVDVTKSVLRDISIGRKPRQLVPWIFAAATSAAAAAIIAIAVRIMIARQDVGAELIDSLFSVTQ
ncbi:MAG: hypothetical protein QGH60_16280 [Phycisphaerae bacterium]|nr:hypothetical protein [Phycisphaerae bacterium]